MKKFGELVSKCNSVLKEESVVRQKIVNIILLSDSTEEDTESLSEMVKLYVEDYNLKCYHLDYKHTRIHKIDDFTAEVINKKEDKKSVFSTLDSIVLIRKGILDSYIGTVFAEHLQKCGFMMVNQIENMLLCDDKMKSYVHFKTNGIPTPKTELITDIENIEDHHKVVGGKFPVILKTVTGTQGIGVSKIDSYESLNSVAQSMDKMEANLIIQEYIDHGDFDVRTIVLDGKIVAATKRSKAKKDFRTNRHRGGDTEPYKLSPEEKKIIIHAAKNSGCYLVGVDHVITDKGDILVLECNGSPGVGSQFMMYANDSMKKVEPKEVVKYILSYIAGSQVYGASTKVAGYHEQLDIEGVGPIRAKFDTGNGTHATMLLVDKLEVKDGIVYWSKDGNKNKHKLKGYSNPTHVGKIDTRPIVHLQVKFNGTTYNDVPFGLSDKRSKSAVLVNRSLITRFGVVVKANQEFILTPWIERRKETVNLDFDK